MITMFAQLSPIVGDSSSSEVSLSGHGARRAGLPEKPEKSVLSWTERPRLDGDILRRGVIALFSLAE